MKKVKHAIVLSVLAASLTFGSATAFASDEKVMPIDLYDALTGVSATTLEANEVLNDVTMEPSLSITTPKLDMSKIHTAIPLSNNDEGDLLIKEELINHGYSDQEVNAMDLGDYQDVSQNWKLSPERIESAKLIYPELADQNLSEWTNEQYDEYIKGKINAEFTPTLEQTAAFEERNITLDDAIWLTKLYDTFDNILAQTDQTLKADLERRYQFSIDNVVAQAEIQRGTRALDKDLYVQVPAFAGYQYANDWFLKSVSTHVDYWRGIQEGRVLKEFRAIYKYNGSLPSYYTTNLYGTFSVKQQGAHEGIDFVYGGTGTKIYNIATGKVRSPKSTHASHHLCIYDEGSNKSYSYLHMSAKSVSVGDALDKVGIEVGAQGMVGNASGPHVHFEVHSDNTSSLGKEKDDNALESISPYQMQIFLGE